MPTPGRGHRRPRLTAGTGLACCLPHAASADGAFLAGAARPVGAGARQGLRAWQACCVWLCSWWVES